MGHTDAVTVKLFEEICKLIPTLPKDKIQRLTLVLEIGHTPKVMLTQIVTGVNQLTETTRTFEVSEYHENVD